MANPGTVNEESVEAAGTASSEASKGHGEVEIAIYAAFFGNLIIALLKLYAAIDSGSSGMFAETAHSFADAGNQLILLFGIRLAVRPPDNTHPFGYGKDRYFWTFMAAVSMFTVGATFSIFHGIQSLNSHETVSQSNLNYVVLGVAAALEMVALTLALRVTWPELKRRGLWRAVIDTKDPTRFIVVLEDSAALIGIVLAAAGLLLVQFLDVAVFDGIAAILIGLLLGAVALILGYESRSLLLGEGVHPAVRRQIVKAVSAHRNVDSVIDLQTMHLGPEQVLVGIEVHLRDKLDTDELEETVNEIEQAVRMILPQADHLFVEAKAPV